MNGSRPPRGQGAPGITIVDGAARFDDLDLEAIYGVQFRRMEEAVNKLLFPDRTVAGLHDCLLQGYQAWWAQAPTVGEPRLLGSSGHGILGTGTHRDQVYVHLHYGGTHGHEHYDALNIILWAKNLELISEGMYRPLPGDISAGSGTPLPRLTTPWSSMSGIKGAFFQQGGGSPLWMPSPASLIEGTEAAVTATPTVTAGCSCLRPPLTTFRS